LEGGLISFLRYSVFKSVQNYFGEIYKGIKSIKRAAFTTLPYLFGLGDLRKEITEQYPDPVSSRTEDDLPPKTRGYLFNDIDKCTGCGDCVVVCPVDCIEVATEQGPDGTQSWVSQFDLDFGLCIFCGFCVEVCPTSSIFHTKQFKVAVTDVERLKRPFGKGKVTEEQKRIWNQNRQVDEFD